MDKNSIFSKKTQSESGLKSKISVGVMIISILFLMSFVVGAELTSVDSIKSYDSKIQTVTLINKTDLTKNIATLKLNTPLINKVGYGGVFKVAEFEVNSFTEVTNALGKIEFYNLNKGMEKIERTIEYKVKGYEDYFVDDYEKVCYNLENKTEVCDNKVIGNHKEQREIWVPLGKTDFSSGEIKTIGIFTYVYEGDKVEWIPTYYGVKIKEWASWIASLDSELIAYFELEDNTTTKNVKDVFYIFNGTSGINTNLLTSTGKVNNGFYMNGTTFFSVPNTFLDLGDFAISMWINSKESGTQQAILHNDWWSASNGVYFIWESTNKLSYGIRNNVKASVNETFVLQNNTWYHLVLTANTTDMIFYLNGIKLNNKNNNEIEGFITNAVFNFSSTVNTPDYFNGTIDEVGMWNRTLTQAEVTALYNNGNGLKYNISTIPEVTINSPINYYNTTNPTLTFNISVYDDFKIQNVSLYIDGELNETKTQPFLCYQESTDNSNQTGIDGNCGLSYTGTANSNNLNDGDWNTYINGGTGTLYFFDYVKPQNVTSGTIRLKDSYGEVNITIPESCFNYNETSLFFAGYSDTSPGETFSTWWCRNSTTWTSPGIYSLPPLRKNQDSTSYLYEEAIYWNTNKEIITYFTKTLSDGEHNWSILAYNNNSNPTQTADRYFTIDYTNPTITITNPLNTTYYTTYTTTNNVTHTYNWTTSDLNLDSCWWSLDDGVTNNTVTCNNNYSFFYPFGQQTFIAWANDSSGNLGVSRVSATWDFMLYELSRFYNSSSVVSASENFILFLNKSSNILTQNATFKYNGISYPVVTTTSGNLINFTTSINIPANANSNNSFNWTIGFTNSTGLFFYNTTSSYQNITNITIAECSTTEGSDFALNFSTYDATNMTSLNTTFEMNFYFYDYTGDGNIVGEFLYTDTSENHSNFLFCMNSSNRNITANAVVSYGAENYDERQYYINNGTISQTVQNISLYLTETDLTDIVTIKLQDQGYVGIAGAYISIQEWNIGTNTYSTIGMCQTSSVGECVMDLELYTTFYRAVVYYEGSIVEITDTQKLSSTSWIITITLEEENPYDLFNNIATSLTFSNITNITTYTWVDTSGYSQRGCLVVKNYTTTGQEIIYNSCTESVSGSIDYLISGDGSYYVYGYIYLSEYGTYKIVEYLEIQLGTLEINRITSPYGKVISFFIIGTLGMVGVAAGSALLGSVLVIIGLILSWKIGFLNITIGFIWSMVVIVLLIIILQNRKQ